MLNWFVYALSMAPDRRENVGIDTGDSCMPAIDAGCILMADFHQKTHNDRTYRLPSTTSQRCAAPPILRDAGDHAAAISHYGAALAC